LNYANELALHISDHAEKTPVAGTLQGQGELPESELSLCALGPLHIAHGSQPVDATSWGYARVKELLFYLLDAPARTKEQIGLALWPNADLTQLRNNLHEALYYLRRVLGRSEWIVYEQKHYVFNRQLPYDYDVERFEQSVFQAHQVQATAPEQAITILKLAILLYRGDFLEDLAVGDWARERRDELRRSYQQALRLLGKLYAAQNQYVQAAETYHKLIVHDRYQEDAHRELIWCYLHLGERGQALRHYQCLASWMHEELRTRPSAETRALLKYLRRGDDGE
jgi:DNA-binding SARP family transcriptional activator